MNRTHSNTLSRSLAIAVVLAGFTARALAQHYPAGSEGIRAATLPPPGVHFRDDNLFGWSEESAFGPGFFDYEIFGYRNEPRLTWMTDLKILGADYGMSVMVPFGYSRVEYVEVISFPFMTIRRVEESRFGLGDIRVEPILLAWHPNQFDFALGYSFWAPTGDFDRTHAVNIGHGFWTHMFTAGATWYPDVERTWAVSLLNRYEIHGEQDETGFTSGQMFTAEWGVSKTIFNTLDIGVVGYWQQQTTETEFIGLSSGFLSHAVAVGPEIRGVIPKLDVVVAARYLNELEAKNRFRMGNVVFTLAKEF